MAVDFRQVLVAGRAEDEGNGQVLHRTGFVAIEYDADDDCEYFAGGDYEWHNVLLELLDHPVHKHLPNCGENGQEEEVGAQLGVAAVEVNCQLELARNDGVGERQHGHPFVDVLEHLQWPGVEL